MAQNPLDRVGMRRIDPSLLQQGRLKASQSRSRRTITIEPPGGGTFTADELGRIIIPANARGFKVIRMIGGRYVRADNPQGLGTEGPFSMSDFPSEDDDLSFMEDQQVTKVIFDVGQ